MQLSLHDALSGAARKAAGQEAIEATDRAFILAMREQAKAISQREDQVTTDDLRRWSVGVGLYPHHQNAYGAIFKGKGWSIIGYMHSALPTNHHRRIAIWKYEP